MDSAIGNRDSGLFHPLVGIIFAAAIIFALTFYSGPGQAELLSDISDQVDVDFDPVKKGWKKQTYRATVVVTNVSAAEIHGPVRVIITEFKNKRHLLKNADGVTDDGYPYLDIDLPDGVLGVGESTNLQSIVFQKMSAKKWKKWKKANKNESAAKDGDEESPGWSEHDFPIKFTYLVDGPQTPTPLELKISAPDAVPGAVQIDTGLVDVRFTVSVLSNDNIPFSSLQLMRERHTRTTNPVTTNLVDNLTNLVCDGNYCCDDYGQCCYDNECCYDDQCSQSELNDDGINGDFDANDGIFTVVEAIDTDELENGECFNYFAVGTAHTGEEFQSDPYLLCATRYNTELIETDVTDINIIPLGEAKVVANEMLVRIAPGASSEVLEAFLYPIHGAIVGTQLDDGIYQIAFDQILRPEALQELIDQIRQLNGIVGVDPNYVGAFTSIPSDPEFSNQHGMQLVSVDTLDSEVRRYVWDAGATGAGVDVILLDSGVNPSLPDDINPKAEFAKDKNDQLGHGTEMAAIIGAPTDNATAIAAMARDARVRAVRISKNDNITLTKMLNGFKRAKGYAGRNKVVSASFSINNMLSDGGVCRKINQIINRGAVVVVSAGNDNDNSTTGIVPGNCKSPAFDPFTSPGPVSSANKNSLIVVGATSCSSGPCETDERWTQSNNVGSNFGSWVDIGAPGVDIPTMTADGSVVNVSGTSASTALVAGAVAILRSCDVGGSLLTSADDSSLDLDQVFNAMDLGAFTPVTGLPGRLNVYHALASVNTVPSGVTLSADQLAGNTDTTGGLAFAEISFSDDTVCDAHRIFITGGADSSSFSIGGDLDNQLVIDDGILDFERQSRYEVEIMVSDFYGESVVQTFIISVTQTPTP